MSDLDELEAVLQAALDRKIYHKLAFYKPYVKQLAFHLKGSVWRERMLRAGNQEGKTYCAAAEVAMHLTGEYPDWWMGRRWDRAVRIWACGESAVVVRDTMQKLLCGQPGVAASLGTGFIPRDAIPDKPSLSRGVTDAYDTVHVTHKSGGTSSVTFKSYEQGREKFQSDTIDLAWCDEEPPEDIYSEILTRITATDGTVMVTFTPLKGRTALLTRFMDKPTADRGEVVMTIYDAEHIKPEDRAKIIEGWPEHEREARAMGVPMMGEGRVFPYTDAQVEMDDLLPDRIPPEWTALWGIDFGHGGDAHPFAGALTLWDRERDVFMVTEAFKTAEQAVSRHVAMIKAIAGEPPVAWPHDGNKKERGGLSGEETTTTVKMYKRAGLNTLGEHATFADGGISTEAAVFEIYNRIREGKFKIAKHLMRGDLGNEFRNYHRKDGLLVKEHDDILSAVMKALMMKRKGRAVRLGPSVFPGGRNQTPAVASDVDFDVLA